MDLSLDAQHGQYRLAGFTPGELTVNDQTYSHSLILGMGALTAWPPRILNELTAAHIDMLIALKPKVILIGTGEQLIFPDPDLLSACHTTGIGVEVMGTAAACRTFSVLSAESRDVVVGLMIG